MIYSTLNIDKHYSVLYADPPWNYRQKGRGAAENHYSTLSLPGIKALPVQNISNLDCSLFLWVTSPFLQEGLEVIKAWGFQYITIAFTWIKLNKSAVFIPAEGPPGYIVDRESDLFKGLGLACTRANSELCLYARRGKPKRMDASVGQVLLTGRSKHSAKPTEAYNRIEKLFDGPKIELFARNEWPGWDAWGDQI